MVSTTALELGIDIGALDVCVMAGYPGTIASTWQRAGRAGRSVGDALIVLLALEDALDYKGIRDRIQKVVAETKFNLLEKLADQSVKELAVDPRILKLELEIDKPRALRLTDSVSAIITWERHT